MRKGWGIVGLDLLLLAVLCRITGKEGVNSGMKRYQAGSQGFDPQKEVPRPNLKNRR